MEELSANLVTKVLDVVDAGLTCGLGQPIPGNMCVEAAVCYAYGLPHNDQPPCVGKHVRDFKIALNDADWSDNTTRAKGLRKLAIAQLGSNTVDQQFFVKLIREKVVKQVISSLFVEMAHKQTKHTDSVLKTAELLKDVNNLHTYMDYNILFDASMVARQCYDEGFGPAWHLHAILYNMSYCSFPLLANFYGPQNQKNSILFKLAAIALETLIELKSPGCEYLYLCE